MPPANLRSQQGLTLTAQASFTALQNSPTAAQSTSQAASETGGGGGGPTLETQVSQCSRDSVGAGA